jgi:hypothetical protein
MEVFEKETLDFCWNSHVQLMLAVYKSVYGLF